MWNAAEPSKPPAANPREQFALDRVRSALLGSTPSDVLVGRYVLSRRLGQGGMSVVHEAYDPQLGRRVAVKFLKPARGGARGLDERRRIAREAQSIARLSHANVIEVFDVGLTDDSVYLVMELVDGPNLRRWLAKPRSQRAVIDALVDAGRGLAAAHDAGIVHRDFKPDNVLVGGDGRVRVVDFGLARPDANAWTPSAETPLSDTPLARAPDADSGAAWDMQLTATGSAMGTPGYMAPEQHDGHGDARSDQFAFCVTVYEALVGQRPYAAANAPELLAAKHRGPPPAPARLDPALWRVIVRGLDPEPARRWPSMTALLDALPTVAAPNRRRRRIGVGLVGVAVTALVLGTGGAIPCPAPDASMAGTWDDAHRIEIRHAMLASGVPYAATTWERIASDLDTRAQQWGQAKQHACEAAATQRWSETTFDQSQACLTADRIAVSATVEALQSIDAEAMQHAITSVARLGDPARCIDPQRLAAIDPRLIDDARLAERVTQARQTLAKAQALGNTGRWQAALRQAELVGERARSIGYGPLSADASFQTARWLVEAGRYEHAATMFEQAHHEAYADHYDQVAVSAAVSAGWMFASRLRDPDRASTWTSKAAPFVERGDAAAIAVTRYHRTLSAVAEAGGDYDAALRHSREALAHAERALDARDPRLSLAVSDVGNDLIRLGRADEALEYLTRAETMRSAALGDTHPSIVDSLSNLGVATQDAGELAAAETILKRALAKAEALQGPQHDDTAMALVNLAVLLKKTGEYDQALPLYERALALYLKLRGPEHVDVAMVQTNMANVLARQGLTDQAAQRYRQALTIWETALSPQHPKTALTLASYGSLLLRRGELDAADGALTRSLSILTERLGPKHRLVADVSDALGEVARKRGELPRAVGLHRSALEIRGGPDAQVPGLADSLQGLGQALGDQGQSEEATTHLQHALQLRLAASSPADALGSNRFALAQVLWSSDERQRAVTLAQQAERDLAELDPTEHDRVVTWLAEHRTA